jgi:hypothetical protein
MAYIFSALGRILRLHERTVIVASDNVKTAVSIPFEEHVGRLLEIKKDDKAITLVYEKICPVAPSPLDAYRGRGIHRKLKEEH